MRLAMILPLLLAVGVVESLRGAKTAPVEPATDPPVPDERVESISQDEQTYRAAADGAPSAPIRGTDGEHNPDFDADALGAAGAETWDAEEHERKMDAMLHEGFPKWDLDSDGKLSRDEVQRQLKAVAQGTQEMEKKRTKADATDAFGKLTDPHGLDADKDHDGVLSFEELTATRNLLMQTRGLMDGEHVPKPDMKEEAMLPPEQEEMLMQMHFLSPYPDEDGDHDFPSKFISNVQRFKMDMKFADANGDGNIDMNEMVHLVNPYSSPRKQQYFETMALTNLLAADTDQDEKLSEKEFMARNWDGHAPDGTLKDQHIGAEEPLLRESFKKADKNGDGRLDLAEFTVLEFPESDEGHSFIPQELDYLFEHDENRDNHLSFDELRRNIMHLGYTLHHDEF